jgi:hypothetical protein
MHSERKPPGTPKCELGESCRVELRGDNEDAAKLYQMVRRQVLFFFNGEVDKEFDINHQAVWAAIDHWPTKVSDPWGLFNKVLRVYYFFLSERQRNEG